MLGLIPVGRAALLLFTFIEQERRNDRRHVNERTKRTVSSIIAAT
jgi:hypothetical protein